MRFKITDSIETNQTTAHLFKRAVKIAGLALPAFETAAVTQPAFRPPTKEEVAEAAYKLASAGKDPSADSDIQKMLLARVLAEQTGSLQYRHRVEVSKAELEYYQSNAPALLQELATAFQEAVETMQEAIPVIGHVTLEDAIGQTGNMPPKHAQAVAGAFAANSQTQGMIEALPYIVAVATGTPLEHNPAHAALAYTKPTYHQFDEHRLTSSTTHNNHNRKHNVWDMLNDGITVELATSQEELEQRTNHLERGAPNSRRDTRAEEAQHSEARAQAKAMGFS
ncbi:hypothetical protein [Paenarthrobacter sp. C1]|uniref:hypothetical protein n=1 Tax=Paenarthrobacter sp. C1 TaxID=3400220 RepID=UPI003BF6189D